MNQMNCFSNAGNSLFAGTSRWMKALAMTAALALTGVAPTMAQSRVLIDVGANISANIDESAGLGYIFNASANVFTIVRDGNYELTGTTSARRVVVGVFSTAPANARDVVANIRLNGVHITHGSSSALSISANSTATLLLAENSNNTFNGAPSFAGIHVPADATLVIDSEGFISGFVETTLPAQPPSVPRERTEWSLAAGSTVGSLLATSALIPNNVSGNGGGAGIGGNGGISSAGERSGNITILGGSVEALGGNCNNNQGGGGAGIGGGGGGTSPIGGGGAFEPINIYGGLVVAVGGSKAGNSGGGGAGIGGGGGGNGGGGGSNFWVHIEAQKKDGVDAPLRVFVTGGSCPLQGNNGFGGAGIGGGGGETAGGSGGGVLIIPPEGIVDALGGNGNGGLAPETGDGMGALRLFTSVVNPTPSHFITQGESVTVSFHVVHNPQVVRVDPTYQWRSMVPTGDGFLPAPIIGATSGAMSLPPSLVDPGQYRYDCVATLTYTGTNNNSVGYPVYSDQVLVTVLPAASTVTASPAVDFRVAPAGARPGAITVTIGNSFPWGRITLSAPTSDNPASSYVIGNYVADAGLPANTIASGRPATFTVQPTEAASLILGSHNEVLNVTATDQAGKQHEIKIPVTFSVVPVPAAAQFRFANSATYNGEAQPANVHPAEGVSGMGNITVKYKRNTTDESYQPAEFRPENAGTYHVYVDVAPGAEWWEARDLYLGSYVIHPKLITDNDIVISLNPASFVYDGTEHAPEVIVQWLKTPATVTLTSADYDMALGGDRINTGEAATVTITGKGNFGAQAVRTFSITRAPQIPFTIVL